MPFCCHIPTCLSNLSCPLSIACDQFIPFGTLVFSSERLLKSNTSSCSSPPLDSGRLKTHLVLPRILRPCHPEESRHVVRHVELHFDLRRRSKHASCLSGRATNPDRCCSVEDAHSACASSETGFPVKSGGFGWYLVSRSLWRCCQQSLETVRRS